MTVESFVVNINALVIPTYKMYLNEQEIMEYIKKGCSRVVCRDTGEHHGTVELDSGDIEVLDND